MSVVDRLNIRWFPCLVRKDADEKTPRYSILTECYSKDELGRKVVVCQEIIKPVRKFNDEKNSRRYAVFESHIDLYTYLKHCDDESKCFHETIIGCSYQKPRFDIDIKESELLSDKNVKDLLGDPDSLYEFAHHVKDRVIEAAISVLGRDGIQIDITKNIIICSSHGNSDGTRKASYHIIIDGYMHSGEEEAQAFFEEVMKELDERGEKNIINRYIDHDVYKRNQNFRLLWNHKLDDVKRVKRLEQDFIFNDSAYTHVFPVDAKNDDHFNIMMLEATMITFTSRCEMLPLYVLNNKKTWDTSIILNDSQKQGAFELLKSKLMEADYITHDNMGDMRHRVNSSRVADFENAYHPDVPFRAVGSKGGLIILERTRPSYCAVCKKIHHKSHPYMFISGGNVYFNCRRSKDHVGKKVNQFIGKVEWNHIDRIPCMEHIEAAKTLSSILSPDEDVRWNEISNITSEEKKKSPPQSNSILHVAPQYTHHPGSKITPLMMQQNPSMGNHELEKRTLVRSAGVPIPSMINPLPRMVNPHSLLSSTSHRGYTEESSILPASLPPANLSPFNVELETPADEVKRMSMKPPPKTGRRRKNNMKSFDDNSYTNWAGTLDEKKKPFM